ncbi:MAG TPA: hypothetical protein VK760_16605 [Candidatus Acidoferrales bacterium]|jgi:hypothetical protein|nr:hypothetical protein [Candidatus Acidoferrales bacterium]
MKRSLAAIPALAAFLALAAPAAAQTPAVQTAIVHHAVSANPQAQAAFDRGLLNYYAYNPEAAEHEFYTASDLDPQAAMAWWGIALSNAPNLNVPPNDGRDGKARAAIRHAKSLESYASPEDRAFIDAAAARFDDTTKAKLETLQANYRDALKSIAATYPDDPDAAALYAEAALYVAAGDSRAERDTWTDAHRAAFTAGVAALLPYYQLELAKFPKHVGLLHFYVHAAQMASESQVAVAAAVQLGAFTFPSEDSHLTHMPGHTYFDVGMYPEALDVGQRSVAMDYADFACCHPGYYSATRYYHNHNVIFVLYAMTQTGHLSEAVALARRENNPAFIARQLVAIGDWKDVEAVRYVKGSDPTVPFARALAYAKLGDAADASAAIAEIPNAPADSPSRAATVDAMRLAAGAQLAILEHDDAKALQMLTTASAQASAGDRLAGGVEMPTLYYYSPHMALAELAIRMGKTDVAAAALQAELAASPRSSAALQALANVHAP